MPWCTSLVTLLNARNCQASDTCCLPPGAAVPRCTPTAVCRYWSCQERHNTHRTGWDNILVMKKKDRARSVSILSVLWGQCILPWSWHREIIHTHPSHAADEGHPSLPTRNLHSSGFGQVPYAYTFSRTKKYTSSPKQKRIFPSKSICLAQAVRALYLHERKCSRPMAHSYAVMQGSIDYAWLPFPTFAIIYIYFYS